MKIELGFFEILFVVFLVLKLTGVVTWPWKIVLLPLWLPIVIFIIIYVIAHWGD